MTAKVNCTYTEMRDLVNLVPHPKNPNQHDEEQIRLLSKIISHQGWRNPIVVSKKSGYIVAGHGRLMAAELLGLKNAPVDLQDFETEADEMAHLVADNRIAELAESSRSIIADIIAELDTGHIDLEITGHSTKALEDLMTAAPPEIDYPELQSGDGDGFRTMTFIVSEAQYSIISESIKEASEFGSDGSNANKNGNGLHGLALTWARRKK